MLGIFKINWKMQQIYTVSTNFNSFGLPLYALLLHFRKATRDHGALYRWEFKTFVNQQ
jgi:hypothetical protein